MSQSRLRESMHTYCERACIHIAREHAYILRESMHMYREGASGADLVDQLLPAYILHPTSYTSYVRCERAASAAERPP